MLCVSMKEYVLLCTSFNNIGVINFNLYFFRCYKKRKKFEISTVLAKWLAQAPNRIKKKKQPIS